MHERELKALAARRGITVEDLLAEEERQRKQEEENSKVDSKFLSPDGELESETNFKNMRENIGSSSFAAELARAIQSKGGNFRNREVVLGDDSGSEEDEALSFEEGVWCIYTSPCQELTWVLDKIMTMDLFWFVHKPIFCAMV